jgi:hypothetical protein
MEKIARVTFVQACASPTKKPQLSGVARHRRALINHYGGLWPGLTGDGGSIRARRNMALRKKRASSSTSVSSAIERHQPGCRQGAAGRRVHPDHFADRFWPDLWLCNINAGTSSPARWLKSLKAEKSFFDHDDQHAGAR